MLTTTRSANTRDYRNLGLILLLALVHGLFFVFVAPPWEHYDEQNHFEYLWMAANGDRLPQPGDNDPALSRKVLDSMLATGFYDRRGYWPEVSPADQPVKMPGYPQLDDPPLYYLLASLPLRLMREATVESQLYTGRLMSLVLFLLTVMISWGVARELTAPGHPLRWMLPASLALLPGFVDLMTAVNNDTLAVVVFSLFTWGSVRLIHNRFSIINLVWVIGVAFLTYFTKNTAMIAIAVLPLVILFGILRGKWRWLAWMVVVIGVIAGMAIVFSWDGALYWYLSSVQTEPVRQANQNAVVGEYVFSVETGAESIPKWLSPVYQLIPPDVRINQRGKPVTLGAWIWASQPAKVATPRLISADGQSFLQAVDVDQQPRFFALHAMMPEEIIRSWVALKPTLQDTPAVKVFYDGLVLVEGDRPVDEAPFFTSPDGSQGEWGGQPFVNLLRNSSAEKAGPQVNIHVDLLGSQFLPNETRPSILLMSVFDWSVMGRFYFNTLAHVFRTFWARFSWGQVPLIGLTPYRWLLSATIFGLLGAILAVIRQRFRIQWNIVLILFWASLLSWVGTLTRGVIFLATNGHYTTTARHSYPVIIPTMLVLAIGWHELITFTLRGWVWLVKRSNLALRLQSYTKPELLQKLQGSIFFVLFAYLDAISIISIVRYY